MLISFLTDYGLSDPFVGVCHGVIAGRCPAARVIDLTHGVPRGDVRTGAVMLLDSLPYLHAGIHLAVVDPGVGTGRRPVAIRAADGRLFVGPDNGLLMPSVNECGGIEQAFDISMSRSNADPHHHARTFDGRDVFAPVAGLLAAGASLDELGDLVPRNELVELRLPRYRWAGDTLICEVLLVDGYGNVNLSVRPGELAGRTEVRVAGRAVSLVSSFAEIPEGSVGLLPDSTGRLSLAVNRGSAASALGLRPGDQIRLEHGT